MRGSGDSAIDSRAGSGGEGGGTGGAPRPPGGKALVRLLDLLGSVGYDGAAAEAGRIALHPDRTEAFIENVGGFATLPKAALPKKASGRKKPPAPSMVAEDAAAEQLRAVGLMGPPTPTGPQWRSLGPWTIPNGQTYGSARINVSGRVAAIAVDPSNPAHVLVGAANGGVWESMDRGASWAPRTDYQATTAVGAIAFDHTNARNVYCGLGEGNWWSWLGTGVLKSTDGGTTWASIATAPFLGQGFYDLQVHPNNGQHLFAATTGGLYTSTDGGSTWTQRVTKTTWSIAIAPGGGTTPEMLAASSDGLHRSTDGGTTWTAVSISGAPTGFNRLAVAIAPSDGTIAYAWGAGPPNDANHNPTPYLYRRAGGRWSAQTTPPGVSTGQAWYDWFLAVSPDNSGQVYCGAISVHRGDLSGTTWSWLDIASKSTGDSIHPDSHAIAFEPGTPSTIYVGSDGGLFQSQNRGVNWVHRNNGLVISEYEYLAQNLGSSRWVFGGTQDNGTDRWTGSPTFDHVADGDGGGCGVNRQNPSTVFHTYYNMSPERSTSGGNFGTWSGIAPPVPQNEGSPFYPPFQCSATNGTTIAMAGNALYVSRDSGTSWTRLAYPSGGSGSALRVPTADSVLVGLGDGRVLHTTWSASGWSALTALTTPRANASVSDIQVDENNNSRIWVTCGPTGGGRVFLSTNGGSSWSDVTAGLPNLPINTIAIDPSNSARAWVGAQVGVYQTTDSGAHWTPFSSSLPNAWIGDLIFHQHARVLRAATRNRGLWEIPVDGWLTQPVCGVQFTGTVNANQSARWFTFNWPATWHVIWTVMPTSVGTTPQVSWNVAVQRASAEYATYWITVTNLTAAPVTFEGRYCILSWY